MIRTWWRRCIAKLSAKSAAERSLREADLARDVRDWQVAAQLYASYLQAHPDNADILTQRAHCLKESGDLRAAIDTYLRAVSVSPHMNETRLHLAHCLKNTEQYQDALNQLQFIVDASAGKQDDRMPNLGAEAIKTMGEVHSRCQDWSAAAASYRTYVDICPEDGNAWLQLGHALKEQGLLAAAADAYTGAARCAPKAPEPWLQLGHVLRSLGPRAKSVQAFARTWVLGNRSDDVVEALRNAAGYSTAEIRNALQVEMRAADVGLASLPDFASASNAPHSLGDIATQTVQFLPGARSIVYLSGIEWGYRRQRPQHMASALADAGHQVIFVSTVFDGGSPASEHAILGVHGKVTEVRLRIRALGANSLHHGMNEIEISEIGHSLASACAALCNMPPVLVVDNPLWLPICANLDRALLVYDCIDNVRALNRFSVGIAQMEEKLIAIADIVVVTSAHLKDSILRADNVVHIPNGVDLARFSAVSGKMPNGGPVRIVYYGAIDAWFAPEWIELAASRHPHWRFLLIGESSIENAALLQRSPNVELLGERPYSELPKILEAAHATIIPFKIDDITVAVDPVKVYEYLAAGRPVIASALPDLQAKSLVRTAQSAEEFAVALADEIANDNLAAHRERTDWARSHTWANRAHLLTEAISQVTDRPAQDSPTKYPAQDAKLLAPLPSAPFILIVAPFPKEGTVVEGWMARIRAVDELFFDTPRVYLNFTSHDKADVAPTTIHHSSKVSEVLLDAGRLQHREFLEAAIKACRFCYVHTVHLARFVLGFYPTGKLITDFHGIVPEEEAMLGNRTASAFYEAIEATVLQCSAYVVVVTRAMERHLRSKYPFARFEALVLPVIVGYTPPSTRSATEGRENPTMIYSGGSQVWQNIDLTLQLVANAPVPGRYIVASHDYAAIAAKADRLRIAGAIEFGSYSRSELADLYARSDFGFVLRDDTAVNRVACPTKLTEYLQFGIVPIVKLVEIGDFEMEGYEYITHEEFGAGIIPGHQQRQMMIARNHAVLERLQAQFAKTGAQLRTLVLPCRIANGDIVGLHAFQLPQVLPWKREAYVFGGKMAYAASQFTRPYTSAWFEFPPGTAGHLVRVVALLGDHVLRLSEVRVVTQAPPNGIPVLVQSRALPVEAGDLFSDSFPFVEIKFSDSIKPQALEVRTEFVEIGPGTWKHGFAAAADASTRSLRICVDSPDGSQTYVLPIEYVSAKDLG